jgi:RHS repeat-associated protein
VDYYNDTVADDTVETVVEYSYNPSGIRTGSSTTVTVDGVDEEQIYTDYHIDPANHTGYAQVFEEITETSLKDTTDKDGDGDYDELFLETTTRIQYTIGDDVISQTKTHWSWMEVSAGVWDWDSMTTDATQYLLYDGHGSTRQLLNTDFTLDDTYSYDGYGVMLQDSSAAPGVTPAQDTSLLYAGEMFDFDSQHYYNRARWYNPYNGRFNRTDPFAGNTQDPQSLHKYLYCHANPINGIDPSGRFFITDLIGVLWTQAKMLGMRTADALRTWHQYSRAKKMLTIIGVGYVVSTAISNYLSGAVEFELPFSKCPLLSKKWPDVTLGITTDRRHFSVKVKYEANSVDSMSGMSMSGGPYIQGTINLETGSMEGLGGGVNLGLQIYPFDSTISSPIKAKLEGKIEGPPVEVQVGVSISFNSPLRIEGWLESGISTGFSLLKVNKAGISLLWGKPWDPVEAISNL